MTETPTAWLPRPFDDIPAVATGSETNAAYAQRMARETALAWQQRMWGGRDAQGAA